MENLTKKILKSILSVIKIEINLLDEAPSNCKFLGGLNIPAQLTKYLVIEVYIVGVKVLCGYIMIY